MSGPPTGGNIPKYFNCLDMVRTLAALVVVIFHYHHFYLSDDGARAVIPPIAEFPYGEILRPIFTNGDKAVEFFWIVSGFVFAHVYLRTGATLGRFFLARFARLYPLHFVTLILVLILQSFSLYYAGHWQIYGNNDTRHFLFQLVLASNSTTLAQGLSFNGPIWSVSLEIVAYLVFFLTLPLLRRSGMLVAIVFAALFWGLALTPGMQIPVLELGVVLCTGYFFTGVVVYWLFCRLAQYRGGLLLATAALLVMGLMAARFQQQVLSDVMVSCSVVLAAGTVDRVIGDAGARLRLAGNISYSLYLVHVPLQMIILLVADLWFDATRGFASSPLLLPAYVGAAIVISTLAFIYVERPAGQMIRSLARSRQSRPPEVG